MSGQKRRREERRQEENEGKREIFGKARQKRKGDEMDEEGGHEMRRIREVKV